MENLHILILPGSQYTLAALRPVSQKPSAILPPNTPFMNFLIISSATSVNISRPMNAFSAPRAIVPLTMLLERRNDPYSQVLGARGLGWLRAKPSVSALVKLLLDESQPYVSRVAAAEALGRIGGEESLRALEQATRSQRPSVVGASIQALNQLRAAEQDIRS